MKPEIVRVWDLPTRLFHWGLLAGVAGLFATAYAPGSWMMLHARLGYAVLTLLAFRLVWGFIGGHWSRFVHILPTPRGLWAYLRGQPDPDHLLGHNPLGALSVVAILVLLAVQVGTGLVSDDEIGFTGPLNRLVSTSAGLAATAWHKGWGQWLLAGLIALHVAAIAFHGLVRGNHLVGPMVHGDKVVDEPTVAARDDLPARLLGAAVLLACGVGVYLLVRPVAGG